MKDYLLDLIQHSTCTGTFDLVKVDSTKDNVSITAYEAKVEPRIIMFGTYNAPFFGFDYTFGMPNLNKLKIILGFDEYGENSKSDINYQKDDEGNDIPSGINFISSTNDFVNKYRFMAKSAITEKYGKPNFSGTNFAAEFEPSLAGVLRLKKQFQVLSEFDNFTIKLQNNDLVIDIGDPSTQFASFTFQSGVNGTLKRPWLYPVKLFLSILDLPGDKKIRLSDDGICEIVVNSGLATWQYYIPAHAK